MRYRFFVERIQRSNQRDLTFNNTILSPFGDEGEYCHVQYKQVWVDYFQVEHEPLAVLVAREAAQSQANRRGWMRAELTRLPTELGEAPVRIWGAVSEQDSTGLYSTTDLGELARMFDERPRQELPQPCPPADTPTETVGEDEDPEESPTSDFDPQ